MIYFGRIHVFEGFDVNKISESKECDICHFLYFLDKGFKFQQNVCNGCHNALMMSMTLSKITILNIQCVVYPSIISGIIN